MDFIEMIQPFRWVEYNASFSVLLDIGEYKCELFKTRADEGFEGNGYDWESLALVFLEEQMPELIEDIEFDSESSMFCVYSENAESLKRFALDFKSACENDELIKDLFSRVAAD